MIRQAPVESALADFRLCLVFCSCLDAFLFVSFVSWYTLFREPDLHTSRYLSQIIESTRTPNPVFELKGRTFECFIETLKQVKRAAANEEYGGQIEERLNFFISKLDCNIREIYLPKDSTTIWDRCDVLITANPNLIECKPEGKISVKIDFEYNENCKSDYEFQSFSDLVSDENNIKNILENE